MKRISRKAQSFEDFMRDVMRRGTRLCNLPKGSKVLEIGVGTASTLEEDKIQFPHLKWFGTSWKEKAYRSY